MSRTLAFSLLLALLPRHTAAGQVVFQPDSPAICFAADEIRRAVETAGEDTRIVVGTYDWVKERAQTGKPPEFAEAFVVGRPDKGIVVAGHDEAGAMYGGLEVAEQITLAGIRSVADKQAKPLLALRQYKFNIPSLRDQQWFHSEQYWRSLFDLFARARINSIGFWHRHPFPRMIRFERFPQAAVLTPEQTRRNIDTWRMIFRLARDRGVSTFLINWNIHLPAGFAEAHGLKKDGQDAPVVRQYMRYCVGETLKTYPRLTGIGACAGEHMPTDDYDWREQWIKDTFIAGIADSGRTVPLLHRYWFASCDSIKRIIAADYPGLIFVPLKFNGEHMYSGFRPHFLDPDWIDYPDYRTWLKRYGTRGDKPIRGVVSHLDWVPRKPYPYKVLWHLRNDCIFTYRWGDPEFVRRVVRNCTQDYSVGYLMGQERTQEGVDTSHTKAARAFQTWKYNHQRHWFRFLLWGRLGYDPAIPDEHWKAVFGKRFGAIGEDLLAACRQTSRVIPLVTRFHFNYMNGDWTPEWCAGGWNTGFGRGYNYRDGRDGFHITPRGETTADVTLPVDGLLMNPNAFRSASHDTNRTRRRTRTRTFSGSSGGRISTEPADPSGWPIGAELNG